MRTYIEVSVDVRGNRQRWKGQGWWSVPEGTVLWDGYCHAICTAVMAGIKSLGLGSEVAFEVGGQSYQIEDDLARRIERINNDLGEDDFRRITWTVQAVPSFTRSVRQSLKGGGA